MPPRPRPRPANRSVAASSSTIPQTLEKNKSDREAELDKEDVFFLRNRNRTAKDWKKLEQREKDQDIAIDLASSDVEEGASITSSPRKRQKTTRRKAPKDSNGMPEWTRQDSAPLLSSDDEDDLEIIDSYSWSEGDPKNNTSSQAKKAKRPRSRSRSITPPPKLTMQQRQNARNVVREALEAPPRSVSPTLYLPDDSTDTIILDPELASIARAVQKQARYATSDDIAIVESGGGPENVTIKVHWRPHPQDPGGRPDIWEFKMKRHDPFTVLFDDVADQAGVLSESLILSHEGSRVYASATPHSLKIWAEADIDASDRFTFDYLREHRNQRPPASSDIQQGARSPSVAAGGDETDTDVQSDQDAADDDDTFKLVVRSASTKAITLTVRPTTTCGAIVKAFLKRAGLADKYPEGKSSRRKSAAAGPRLMIDGERMSPETPISEAELEDGDQIEVSGL